MLYDMNIYIFTRENPWRQADYSSTGVGAGVAGVDEGGRGVGVGVGGNDHENDIDGNDSDHGHGRGRQPTGRLRGLGSSAAPSAGAAVLLPVVIGAGGDASTAEGITNEDFLAASTASVGGGGGGAGAGAAESRGSMAESGIVARRNLLVNCPVGYFGDCEYRVACSTYNTWYDLVVGLVGV